MLRKRLLLNMAFAEYGFAGARIDAIAIASGYNKSMIFHYFGDMPGLYLWVFKRTAEQGLRVQAEAYRPLLADETLTSDVRQFRIFLERAVRTILDLLVEHPRLARIYDLCLSSQTALPRYRMTMKERDFSTPEALMFTRAQRVDFIIHEIMGLSLIHI